jgi:hypothetical protein
MNGYRCPHCKNTEIIDYGDSFDCPSCNLKFEKRDINEIKDENSILAIEEKLGIIKTLTNEI